MSRVRIAAFPKCYMDDLVLKRTMTIFDWIDMAKSLGADGLELYEGFLTSTEDDYIDSVAAAINAGGFEMPMFCCSPDFTNPDPEKRQEAIEFEARMIRISRRLGSGEVVCRILTGQRYPEVSIEQGVNWVSEAIRQLLPIAREHDVILGLENHFKDGYWEYPEFAQKKEVFLAVLNAVSEREYFGVQYDPSNAIVAGDDPIELLNEVIDRVVSMHASDRYLVEGATLDDLRQSDGILGYSPYLRHGVVGQGLNDYDAIFSILSSANYSGWISIEDGMNGMDEMRQSINFLKRMRAKYFSEIP